MSNFAQFITQMRSRNLIFALIAAFVSLFIFQTADRTADASDTCASEMHYVIDDCSTAVSPVKNECSLPRPTNYTAPTRINSSIRRDNSTNPTLMPMLKAGKVVDNTPHAVYINIIRSMRSGIKEPDTWFISLHKFLI